MSMYTAKDVVDVARQWLGWHEEGNNGNPFDEVLAPYSGEIDINAEWCDLFNDYCHFIASDCDADTAQYVLCGPFDDYTVNSAEYYMDAGRWGQDPQYGAQVFFGNSGISHTGIVVDVRGDVFDTIEGNSGDEVRPHTYSVGDPYVRGFGYPRYGSVEPIDESEDIMQFLYQPDDKQVMRFFDGTKVVSLSHPDQMQVIIDNYKRATGKDIAIFKLGTKEAPWGKRFEQCFPMTYADADNWSD